MISRLKWFLPVLMFILVSVDAMAACPANVPSGVTNCRYIDAVGSDSNDGLSEATGHPWAHAPFMPNCSGNCLTLQNSLSGTAAAGYGFIFRGNDVWHFGNSGATPYTGGTWEFNTGNLWSGTSTNPIYFGVDTAWFSGGSWGRPIMTGDNPLCNAGTVGGSCHAYTANYWQQYYVTSCTYQTGSANNLVDASWISYYYFDSLEFTGSCMQHTGQPFASDTYVVYLSVHGQHTFNNLYIHGWTHTAFAGFNGSGACTSSTVCMNTYAFVGTGFTSTIPADKLRFVVVDGADSDPVAGGAFFSAFYDVAYSVFRYESQGLGRQFHLIHDNLFEYFFENGHSNIMESTPEWNGTNVVYNNVYRHLETTGGTNGVGIWMFPNPGNTDYIFNNIIYDEGQMELINVGGTEGPGNIGTNLFLNNTFDFTSGTGNNINCDATGHTNPILSANNHFITETAPIGSNCLSQLTSQTNTTMNHATASAAGYTTSQTFVNSPTSGSSPTVNAGTNQNNSSTICANLATAAAGDSTLAAAATACGSDTTYGVVYNATTHVATTPGRTSNTRPASGGGAWNTGAYQFNSANPAVTVNTATTFQTIAGFGGYGAFSPLTGQTCAGVPCQTFFFQNLGYSLLRVSLPLDDSCSSAPSAACTTNGGVADATDISTCLANGCKVWATVSSPPADMKSNGNVNCVPSGAFLLPGSYSAYATYMSNYIASMATYRSVSPLLAISVQNEPDTCFLGSSTQAFSYLSGTNFDTFVKTNLGPTMTTAGQTGTLIMIPETQSFSDYTAGSYSNPCMTDGSCSPFIGITAFHDYDNAGSFSNLYPSLPYWQTEVSAGPGFGPTLCGGCWDPSIANAMMYAQILHNSMVGGMAAWHYFWFVDPATSTDNTDAALVNNTETPSVAIRTYVIAQWAKFVRPGWLRVSATANPQGGVYVTAFKDPGSANLAIVAVNTNSIGTSQQFNLNGIVPSSVTPYDTTVTDTLTPKTPVSVVGGSYTYTLPASSVTTFVGSTTATPLASLSTTSLSFGNQQYGSPSAAQTVTITNVGGASLVFTNYALTVGTQYSITSNTCTSTYSNTLPAGQACIISIVFDPTGTGVMNDTLTLTNNSGGTPGATQTVSLTGTGTLWAVLAHNMNNTCAWSAPAATQSCTVTLTTTATGKVLLALAAWSSGSTPTVNQATEDGTPMTQCTSCYAVGTNSPKAFITALAYDTTPTAGTHTYTFTLNTGSSASGNIDVEAIQVSVAFGPISVDNAAAQGYTNCTTPCTSPSLTIFSHNDYVLQLVALGFGPPPAPGAPYTSPSDIDNSNVWGGFFGATEQATVTPITYSSTAGNYPATAVIALQQGTGGVGLSVGASNGTISGTNCFNGSFPSGTAIGPCTASANTGYTFTGWSGTGNAAGCTGTTPCTFSLTVNSTLTANFTPTLYTVTFNITGSGASGSTISGTNCASGSYAFGTAIGPCTANPAAGIVFGGWSGASCSGTGTCSITVGGLACPGCVVNVTFLQKVATPVPNVPPGTYASPLALTFTDSTPGASMFCTTDGSTPTISSPPYSPFTLTTTHTVQCIGALTGDANSDVGGGLYTISGTIPAVKLVGKAVGKIQ